MPGLPAVTPELVFSLANGLAALAWLALAASPAADSIRLRPFNG